MTRRRGPLEYVARRGCAAGYRFLRRDAPLPGVQRQRHGVADARFPGGRGHVDEQAVAEGVRAAVARKLLDAAPAGLSLATYDTARRKMLAACVDGGTMGARFLPSLVACSARRRDEGVLSSRKEICPCRRSL